MPKPFLDIAVESDRKTKLHMLFNFEEDNKWELKIDRIPGQKMTIEAVIDGQKWTGVGTLNQGDMKLNLKVDNNNMMPKPFLDIAVESDRKTKLHMLFNFEEDNKWELKIDRVPGQKMTIEATINGQKWTGVGN